ncbi:MAG: asparagine synthase (glutamine-hydrolyzing), partial [Chloroflexi bacterium]|nr:asparagine synthase (glutamine-hydrolyzing) [Chloroflexota bacterium]
GEIYNYLELVPELQAHGHHFRSRTDTEVIIHAYEQWGEDCVRRFNGMWGIALWDTRRRTLFCSRDRFGVKPFYYRVANGTFSFATELKALLAHDPSARVPNYPYLLRFLLTSIFDDGDETFFEGIHLLLPAHSLTLHLPAFRPHDSEIAGQRDSGIAGRPSRYPAISLSRNQGATGLRVARYWDWHPESRSQYDYTDPAGTLRELLIDSVRLRLRSDVPVGTCLSGGLDSSAIVAIASGLRDAPISTFSALYDDPECDERRFVDTINERFNTEPHPVYPDGQDLAEVLPRIVWHQDGPTAGPGLYSQWHVMRTAHGHVKVLLDGQGGDELLGGYYHYFGDYLATLAERAVGRADVAAGLRLVRELPAISGLTGRNQIFPLLKNYTPDFARRRYRRAMGTETSDDVHAELLGLVNGNRVPPGRARERPRRFSNRLNDSLYYALTRDSIPALLHYEDRNSMAFSIEARVPFLDYRVAEFCLGLPFHEKINGATTKDVLRRAIRGLVPDEIVDRRDKKGYPTPLAHWLRGRPGDWARDVLFAPECRARHIFDPDVVAAKLAAHRDGRQDYSWQIWRWLTVELWFQQFVDQSSSVPSPAVA